MDVDTISVVLGGVAALVAPALTTVISDNAKTRAGKIIVRVINTLAFNFGKAKSDPSVQ